MMNPFFGTPPPPMKRKGRWHGPSPGWPYGRASCCWPRYSLRRSPGEDRQAARPDVSS